MRFYFGKSYQNYKIYNSEDLALYILNEAHVACVGGASFGDENCLRFSFAASEESIHLAFDRIEVALQKLQ